MPAVTLPNLAHYAAIFAFSINKCTLPMLPLTYRPLQQIA